MRDAEDHGHEADDEEMENAEDGNGGDDTTSGGGDGNDTTTSGGGDGNETTDGGERTDGSDHGRGSGRNGAETWLSPSEKNLLS